MTVRSRLLARVLLLAAAGAFLLAGPAAAVSPPTPNGADVAKGKVGSYIDRDDDRHPAVCHYSATGTLDSFQAAGPVAWPAKGHATQKIGSRMVIETWNGSAWTTWKAAPWVKKTAGKVSGATFRTQTVTGTPADGQDPSRFRIDLRWYAADGHTVTGRVSLWRDSVTGRLGSTVIVPANAQCSTFIA